MKVVAVPIVGTPPVYAHEHDAGCDLVAVEDATIRPGERAGVSVGITINIPPGFEGQIRPRSGLAIKHGITVLNAPGTVDAGYTGTVKVVLANTDKREEFVVQVGDRIAQLVLQEVVQAKFVPVHSHNSTDRNDGGFGSTGIRPTDAHGNLIFPGKA